MRALLLAAACGRLRMIDLTIMFIMYTAGKAKRVRVRKMMCQAKNHAFPVTVGQVPAGLFDAAQRLWYTGIC